MSQDYSTKASPEQMRYANMLFYGCWSSLALMVFTYLLYVLGIVEPHIPLDKIPELWTLPVGEYLKQGNVPTGWGWANLVAQGDFMNFIGIALLAGMTILCYIPLLPAFLSAKKTVMFWIALAEIIVLLVAASGIFGAGAH